MRYYFLPIKMARIKKTENKCWYGRAEIGTLMNCWWECKIVQPLGKTVWWFLKKWTFELLFHPAIPCMDIYTKNWKQELKQTFVYPCLEQHYAQ